MRSWQDIAIGLLAFPIPAVLMVWFLVALRRDTQKLIDECDELSKRVQDELEKK